MILGVNLGVKSRGVQTDKQAVLQRLTGVLRLDIVDKSTSPLQTHLGPVFGDEAVQRGLLFLE
jgi:hypothetical protein